jgi:hypothetical protein
MNVYEMEAAIRATLNEPTQTCISSAEVLSVLNDGYKDVASKALCIEEETLLPIEENEKIIASGGLKVQYAQITDAVLAEVSYTVTAPVGYDTWTCEGVEYQGKIVTVGTGMMYTSPNSACGAIHGLPPYTKQGLVLIYPGTYYSSGFNIITASGAGYYTFVRGVGDVDDIIIQGNNPAVSGSNGSYNVIEGFYLQQNYPPGWPPFMVSDGLGTGIFNKCRSTQQSTAATVMIGSNAILDMRYCTCATYESSSYGTIYSYYGPTDNTKSHVHKSQFSKYLGVYGGTGGLGVEDYVEIPTSGYGYEYGDYLVSDWEFDGTKKKMSYGGGAAVDVAAGGSFTLTNTDGASIDIYVVADDLPASDDTFTIYNSKYVNGVIIV